MYSKIDEDIKQQVEEFKKSQLVIKPTISTPSTSSSKESSSSYLIAGALLGVIGLFGAYSYYDEMQYRDENVGFVTNKDDIC